MVDACLYMICVFQVRFVPASGLSAENISRRDPHGPLSAWYDGPTLLEAIDAFSPAPRATDKPFRMCVADVMATGKVCNNSSLYRTFFLLFFFFPPYHHAMIIR